MKILDILNEGDKERALESFIKKIIKNTDWKVYINSTILQITLKIYETIFYT